MSNTQLINELNDKIEILEFQNKHLKELLKQDNEHVIYLQSVIKRQSETCFYLLNQIKFLLADSKDLRNIIESKQTSNLKLVA